VEALVKTPPKDCTIVVEAGALKKDSPLRKLCERDKNAAAIECYPDSERDVLALIDHECKAAELTINKDARALLASLLGQDRLTTRSELAKLILYSRGNGEIDRAAIDAIISDASSLFLDNAIKAAFKGDIEAIEPVTRRFFSENGDANMLLAMALRTGLSLHQAKEAAGSAAALELEARGDFRARPLVDFNLKDWSAAKLAEAIENLAAAIKEVRLEPKLGEPLAVRALWFIALSVRKENSRSNLSQYR
jgi:DNA polymerase-3 subunit delta